MSDFSDRPFVAGSITGLRSFRIDSIGRLTGVVHQDVWRPGENEAVCHSSDADDVYRQMARAMASYDRVSGKKRDQNYYTMSRPAPKPQHQIAGVACQCGFYAYFDGGNDYLHRSVPAAGQQPYGGYIYFTTTAAEDTAPRVAAIINGWGLVTVGDRGFRASKAEVVALISPESAQARHEVAFAKVRRNYPELTVYSTEREAVQAFPLSDPIDASPSDDDFWTRSAR